MDINFILEVRKTWSRLKHQDQLESLFDEIDLHKKIHNVFHVGPFYYFVFDIHNFKFQYMSPDVKQF